MEINVSLDEMQLAQIYGGEKIDVSASKVHQQNNYVDCRVFAIAFCTEYCFTGRKGILEAEFNLLKMRQHLLTCLENMELFPFPKIRRKLKLEKKLSLGIIQYLLTVAHHVDIRILMMIWCNEIPKKCLKWFHYYCAGLSKATDSMLYVFVTVVESNL